MLISNNIILVSILLGLFIFTIGPLSIHLTYYYYYRNDKKGNNSIGVDVGISFDIDKVGRYSR